MIYFLKESKLPEALMTFCSRRQDPALAPSAGCLNWTRPPEAARTKQEASGSVALSSKGFSDWRFRLYEAKRFPSTCDLNLNS